MGYSWDEVHDIAEQLEHIRDYDLPDRLDKFLGFPKYDPHGDPIPQSNGNLPAFSSIPLSEAAVNRKMKVVKVSDDSPDFLRYLENRSIGLNELIQIREIQEFDKSVLVELKGKKRNLPERRSQAEEDICEITSGARLRIFHCISKTITENGGIFNETLFPFNRALLKISGFTASGFSKLLWSFILSE